jgi:hypothetical protein
MRAAFSILEHRCVFQGEFVSRLVGHEELSESLSRLQSRILRATEELAKAQLSSTIQVRLVLELLQGRRTVTELVESIYSVGRGGEGFSAHYYQLDSELRDLESKGIVWRRPFGRNKPYSLTQLGIARLTAIGGVRRGMGTAAFSKLDLAAFSSVVILGIVGIWMNASQSGQAYLTPVAVAFFIASGFALSRLVESLRRVV